MSEPIKTPLDEKYLHDKMREGMLNKLRKKYVRYIQKSL